MGRQWNWFTTSLEMIVLTDELVAMTNHFVKGINVTDETIALEVIDKVGPGGNFVDEEHTAARFRVFWSPQLLDRNIYENWQANGSLNLNQKLNRKVRELIENYRPEPLAQKAIEKIMNLARHSRGI